MSKHRSLVAICALVVAFFVVPQSAPAKPAGKNQPHATLTAFKSDAELLRYLERARQPPPLPVKPQPAPSFADPSSTPVPEGWPPPPPPPAPPPPPSIQVQEKPRFRPRPVTLAVPPPPDNQGISITNTQEADVDEGDIVKLRGDTLIILRRGRLFTVSIANGQMKPVDSINAYPPGADARGDWYDEMLVTGNRVIVIGYSYARGGTEIDRFHIDDAGHLAFEDAYHLRSNDYYSSRNYASRLIGTKLVVYSPLYLPYGDYLVGLPALRRWHGQEGNTGFRRIVGARQIYIPAGASDPAHANIEALHTVTSCDLTARVLDCNATSVLGPGGRSFYVSSHAAYVWVADWPGSRPKDAKGPEALLYRLPLDGSAPSAIAVHGSPVDQFSFDEDWSEGALNVLVRAESGGDAMWNPEFAAGGAVALLRVPLDAFGDGSDETPRRQYRLLPKSDEDSYGFQNRFVGDYVLYGTGNSWGSPTDKPARLVIAKIHGRGVWQFQMRNGVDRIEAMGEDALVVGANAEDLIFQAIELGSEPWLGDRYTLRGASQGETRSHAFFFKSEPSSDGGDGNDDGVLALPVAHAGRPTAYQLEENPTSMLFIRRRSKTFRSLGEIPASDNGIIDDACVASCMDWYGNARPIFLADRTFALMGYELVETNLGDRRVQERARITFAPRAQRQSDRP